MPAPSPAEISLQYEGESVEDNIRVPTTCQVLVWGCVVFVSFQDTPDPVAHSLLETCPRLLLAHRLKARSRVPSPPLAASPAVFLPALSSSWNEGRFPNNACAQAWNRLHLQPRPSGMKMGWKGLFVFLFKIKF